MKLKLLILFIFLHLAVFGADWHKEEKALLQSITANPVKNESYELVLGVKAAYGRYWYCLDEDWITILRDIDSGRIVPMVAISAYDKKRQKYLYFVRMTKPYVVSNITYLE